MTLIVSLISPDKITLVADRRISSAGETINDQYNKICVYCCHDGRVIMAFTGLATFEGFDTSAWLMRDLHSLSEAGIDRIFDAVEMIRQRLGEALSNVGLSGHRLAVVVAGFWYEDNGTAHQLYWRVTNVADDGAVTPNFRIESEDISKGHAVFFAGMTGAVPGVAAGELEDLVARSLSRTSLIRKAVNVLQTARDATSSLRTIGEYSSSVTIQRAIDTTIMCTYHAPTGASTAYGPNAVITGAGCFEGPQIMSATLLAGPSIHKNQRCWCNSGKKFKHCHLKKFGSVYMRLPGFAAPLPWTISIRSMEARPSGSNVAITGGFE